MPIDKNKSHEEVVQELLNLYKKTGKIGNVKPKNIDAAKIMANAIAYNIKSGGK